MKAGSVLLALVLLFAAGVGAEEKPQLKSQSDKVSYSIGLSIGTNLKRQAIDVDMDWLSIGIKDALSGGDALLTDDEVKEVMNTFQEGMRAKLEEERGKLAEKNIKDGEVFLAENKKKKDVVTLPSGLQYKILKKGNGDIPKAADTVTTHYIGSLIDGTEFDSSYSREEPTSFPVGGVIAGWTEALQLMPVGSKWMLFVPSALAYGERGAGQAIGPNATLIFEVELLSINQAGMPESQ
jgi:FKBP-type peptidyl-prolyl cis-trans isomerase FklB